MSKRKDPKRRTPGTLDGFARGGDAAERLAALDVVIAAVRPEAEKAEPAVAEVPTARARLSALVGREVADVRRTSIMRRGERGPGVHQPLGWYLRWAGGGESPTFESHELRREDRLNEIAVTHWRRPLAMPRLTGDEGRRLIRLLHEVIENRVATAAGQSTTTNGVDR